jgi:hypothetical protein
LTRPWFDPAQYRLACDRREASTLHFLDWLEGKKIARGQLRDRPRSYLYPGDIGLVVDPWTGIPQ